MTYRQQIEKIYKKLDLLGQRGEDAIMDFRDYVDEIVSNSQYTVFEDVITTKYNIDMRKYKFIEDVKKDLFKEIRFKTKSKYLKNLNSLISSKNLYLIGSHYYDSVTNKYLGDITEKENEKESKYSYIDRKLASSLGLIGIPDLIVTVGLSSSIYDALPEFEDSGKNGVLNFPTYSQVTYFGKVYESIKSFTWNFGKQATPTYSEYWTFSSFPTYSLFSFTSSISLLDKYELALTKLRDLN
jgi:hypothetical protein